MTSIMMRAGELFVPQIAQVTLLILLVGLITRLFCHNRPYLALALWSVVLVKCVVPPLVYSPCGMFCWMDSIAPEHRQPARTLETSVVDPTETGLTTPDHSVAVRARSQGASMPASRGHTSSLLDMVRAGQTNVANALWPSISFAVWFAGAAVLLIVYAIRCHLFLRRVRQDRRCTESSSAFPTVERLVRRLSRYIGLRHAPRLVLSDSNVGPAVFGLLRPTVILPLALVQQCTIRQLTPIVLHELLHIRRGDLWLALHSVVVRIIWWFHPLVWWSVRRTEWESERCCDESVVACMRRGPGRYAHSLINTLEQSYRLKTSFLVPGVRPVDITANRLERIMRLGQGSRGRMPPGCWILAILASALVLPGASSGLAQPPESTKEFKDIVETEQLGRSDAAAISAPPDRHVRQASHAAPLGKEQRVPSTDAAGPPVVKVYVVGDLLVKLKRDEGWPEDTPDERLKRALVAWLRQFSFRPEESYKYDIAAKRLAHVGAQSPTPPEPQTRFAWDGNGLIVRGSEESHKRLAREIETRRKYSFRQVTVEVRFMLGAPQLCMQTDPESPSEIPHEGERLENRWILFQQDFANESAEQLPPHVLPDTLGRDTQAIVPNGPSASVTTGKSDPIVYQFVDDRQFKSFMSYLETDWNNTNLQAPKVTLFDGQTAEISDTSQQPFVTDVTKVVGDYTVAYQPVIKVLWEGSRIRLTPEITPEGHRMKCRFMFASIDDCKAFRSPRYPDAKDIEIQHPVVSTTTFECAIDIPTGQTLLIGGLFPQRVEREAEQSMFSRLLGRQPPKAAHEQVMFISITPRTIVPE